MEEEAALVAILLHDIRARPFFTCTRDFSYKMESIMKLFRSANERMNETFGGRLESGNWEFF